MITREDTHEKKIIFHPLMMPKVAVEDPELAVGLPPFLTMAAGMDALAHCFEAYCVNAFHPLADGVALEGIKIVDTYLPRAVADGSELEARAYMFAAASMGATAFQKGLGAIHSVSHPIGARYDTHHGLTNGVIFPYVMVCNRKAIADKIPHIARALDLPGRDFDTELGYDLAESRGTAHAGGARRQGSRCRNDCEGCDQGSDRWHQSPVTDRSRVRATHASRDPR